MQPAMDTSPCDLAAPPGSRATRLPGPQTIGGEGMAVGIWPDRPWPAVTLAKVEVLLLNEPIQRPVRTSFGVMASRPGLLIRITDDTGSSGYGEVWSNFPEGGARYKATLATRCVAPALIGTTPTAPQAVLPALEGRLTVLGLQCADFGSLAQVMAGVDQAIWDLFCKRVALPLWQICGASARVPVYASGIGPAAVAETILEQARQGHVRFKIKLGFGDQTDEESLAAACKAMPAGSQLLVDVNQGWSFDEALRWVPRLAAMGIVWCEEPLRADAPWSQWRRLSEGAAQMRIAGGENFLGLPRFVSAVEEGGMRVLQPDLGKWGGLSANFELAHRLAHSDVWLCPHWLAGGVGLMASLQFKAAVCAAGWVEVDANPNPLRTAAFAQPLTVEGGFATLPATPGIVPEMSARFDNTADWASDITP